VLVKLRAVLVENRLAESVNGTEWRSEIVGDGIAEGFEFLVRLFKLFCPFLPDMRQFQVGFALGPGARGQKTA
jgi:hypothetical protein